MAVSSAKNPEMIFLYQKFFENPSISRKTIDIISRSSTKNSISMKEVPPFFYNNIIRTGLPDIFLQDVRIKISLETIRKDPTSIVVVLMDHVRRGEQVDFLSKFSSVVEQDKLRVISSLYDTIVRDGLSDVFLQNVRLNLATMISWLDELYPGIKSVFCGYSIHPEGVRKILDYLQSKGSIPADTYCVVCENSTVFEEQLFRFKERVKDSKETKRQFFFIRNFHKECQEEHMTLVYAEKTEYFVRFFDIDSMGEDIFSPALGEKYNWFFSVIKKHFPESFLYAAAQRRQKDLYGCKVFCIRDAVYMSKHQIFEETRGLKSSSIQIDGTQRVLMKVANLPPALLSCVQSYSTMKEGIQSWTEESILERAEADQQEAECALKTGEQHAVCIDSHKINRLIADRNFKYGRLLIRDWCSRFISVEPVCGFDEVQGVFFRD